MKIIKKVVLATSIVLAVSSYSVHAEICLGMACMYNKMTPLQGIQAVLVQVNEAQKSINDKAGQEVIIENIKEALATSKEINANDKVDRNRNRANDSLKKARAAVKEGDSNKATEFLKEAEVRFNELKGMLDLTQADRVAQQTPMLNRILEKADR